MARPPAAAISATVRSAAVALMSFTTTEAPSAAKASASAGTYLVGDEVTIADVCLVPQLYGARRFGVDVAPYPTLARVEAALVALPAFAAAHPDAQPDAQPA
jgi:glutathione S-transferase